MHDDPLRRTLTRISQEHFIVWKEPLKFSLPPQAIKTKYTPAQPTYQINNVSHIR